MVNRLVLKLHLELLLTQLGPTGTRNAVNEALTQSMEMVEVLDEMEGVKKTQLSHLVLLKNEDAKN